ncbi:hypothetical protein CIG19_18940 [Enterobacterales bacterium CwR94]|nr:hypothetical protein CIG19_18940 [Enterobacterales bacterium CwR94]
MNEQQVSDLLKALAAQTLAMSEQSKAIQQLAESSLALVTAFQDALSDDLEMTTISDLEPTYLSGKPRR